MRFLVAGGSSPGWGVSGPRSWKAGLAARQTRLLSKPIQADHFPLYCPEQVAAGLVPWLVQQVYYFAKSPIETNRAVDISGEPLRRKVAALWEHTNQMVLTVAETQANVAAAPYDVSAISALDPHDYHSFIKQRVRATAAMVGKKYGFEHAEQFRRTRWGGTERMAEGAVTEDEW